MSRLIPILIATALIALLVWAFRPLPILVEISPVTRGAMTVTVDNEGKTRVKDRYTVSAPLAGRLQRLALKPGDQVEAGKTLIAVIDATAPELLNPRSLAEAAARVKAAEATVRQFESQIEQAKIRLEFANRDLDRITTTSRKGASSQGDLETAQQRQRGAKEEIRAAEFASQVASFELEQARAALDFVQPSATGAAPPPRFEILAPISGLVFRVFEESATVVTPGTRLLELADPAQLEVEVDLLTTRAVEIRPGTRMIIDHWGGPAPLEARVRVVEPSAFTKVSALGIEEQRVNVIGDFTSPPEERIALGDGFRIEARLVTWEGTDVLKVAAGALFREASEWAVFVNENDRAVLRPVTIGQRNDLEAEVLKGLSPSDTVLLYPNDQIQNGTRITSR